MDSGAEPWCVLPDGVCAAEARGWHLFGVVWARKFASLSDDGQRLFGVGWRRGLASLSHGRKVDPRSATSLQRVVGAAGKSFWDPGLRKAGHAVGAGAGEAGSVDAESRPVKVLDGRTLRRRVVMLGRSRDAT